MPFAYIGTLTVTSNATLLPSTQTNYPLLVSVTDNSLKLVANGGQVTDAEGDDIVFCSNAALTAHLDYQIEKWDGATGELIAWVRIPSLALGTVFYLGIGDSSITTFQGNITGTWNANFHSVYHLDDLTGNLLDSTSNAYDSTFNSGQDVAGQIDRGKDYNGSSQFTTTPARQYPQSAFTLSAWLFHDTSGIHVAAAAYAAVSAGAYSQGPFSLDTDCHFRIFKTQDTDYIGRSAPAGTLSTGAWHLIHCVWDGGTTNAAIKIYKNGAQVDNADDGLGTFTAPYSGSTVPFYLATQAGGFFFWDGKIDEVRLMSVAVSANWALIDYNSQVDNATFVSKIFAPPLSRKRSHFLTMFPV